MLREPDLPPDDAPTPPWVVFLGILSLGPVLAGVGYLLTR